MTTDTGAKGKGFWRRRRRKSTEPAASEPSPTPPADSPPATPDRAAATPKKPAATPEPADTNPTADTKTDTDTKSAADTKSVEAPKPAADAKTDTDTKSAAETKSTEAPKPAADAKAAGDAEPSADADIVPSADTEPSADADADVDPSADADVEPSVAAEPSSDAGLESGAKLSAEAAAGATPDDGTKADADAKPTADAGSSDDSSAAEPDKSVKNKSGNSEKDRPAVGITYEPEESPDGFPLEFGEIIVGLPKGGEVPQSERMVDPQTIAADVPAEPEQPTKKPTTEEPEADAVSESTEAAEEQSTATPDTAADDESSEAATASNAEAAVQPPTDEPTDDSAPAEATTDEPADDSASAEATVGEAATEPASAEAADEPESTEAAGEPAPAAVADAPATDKAADDSAPGEATVGEAATELASAEADEPVPAEAADDSAPVEAAPGEAAGDSASAEVTTDEPAGDSSSAEVATDEAADDSAPAEAAAPVVAEAGGESAVAEVASGGAAVGDEGAEDAGDSGGASVVGDEAAADSAGSDESDDEDAAAEDVDEASAGDGAAADDEAAAGSGDEAGDEPEVALSAEEQAAKVAEQQAAMALITALMKLRGALADSKLPLDVVGADEARQQQKAMLDQLDDYVLPRLVQLEAPVLAVVGGSTGAGKSTLVNSLIGQVVSEPGVLRPTTRSPVLIHNPADAEWFAGDRVLPGMARSSGDSPGGMEDPGQIRLVAADTIPRGLAVLDAPDIDSVVEANRELATQLLAAADLWLFVTTAARYADAVPWEFLQSASDRSTAVAVVLDRAPADTIDDITGHLAQMLLERGLGDSPLFSIKETVVDERGMLPAETVASIKDWLIDLAADAEARSAVVRRTLQGAVTAMTKKTPAFSKAVRDQADTLVELRANAETAYERAVKDIATATQDGTMLRGEVLARWQEFVGTGELLKGLQTNVGRLRDKVRTAVVGKPPPTRDLNDAVESGLESLLREHAEAAAERAEESWQSTGAGRQLLAAGDRDLGRMSKDFPAAASRAVREWQGFVLDLVRKEGADKRSTARILAYGVNGLGLSLMVVIFASTAGITGAEVGVGAGTAVVGQKLLEAVFGDQAVRTLAAKARQDLDDRVHALMDAEFARYLAVLDQHPVDSDAPRQLTEAARAVEDCT